MLNDYDFDSRKRTKVLALNYVADFMNVQNIKDDFGAS